MNLVLHNKATAEIKGGYSTFSDPQYMNSSDDSVIRSFDFAVVNPPFSDKNWTHGLKECGRFDGYGERPPQKNGDFAWLLHIIKKIKSLKRNGKAAVILPHGVLFRGNSEATIRQNLIEQGYIKGIIGLPANLFYGTGIPACIIVIDKENADERGGIIMIDASREFIKGGNKNRLRERDVYKITTVFNSLEENHRAKVNPKYARYVPFTEIKEKNDYNLNIPRYIDSRAAEDTQSIEDHLNGGIPVDDVDSLSLYWETFPNLKSALFAPLREGFYSLAVEKGEIRNTIYCERDFSAYSDKVENAFENWKNKSDKKLRTISATTKPKCLISDTAEDIIAEFEAIKLIDKYDAYEVLLSYWNETMSDDVYLIVQDDYEIARDIEVFKKTTVKKKKNGAEVKQEKETGWDGKLLPKTLIIEMFFADEQKAINDTENVIAPAQAKLDEIIENAEEDSIIHDVLKDNENLDKTGLKKRLKSKDLDSDEKTVLQQLQDLLTRVDEGTKTVKELRTALDKKTRDKYSKLTDKQIFELLLNRKWYRALVSGIYNLYTAVSHRISERVLELADRYENTFPQLEADVDEFEIRVKSHLGRMGFKW